jgi:uncharacterized protein (DUF433 family)
MTTIVAFTADHVCQLTGLTKRQLSYWDRTGFFAPRYADENRRRPFSRIYDFRDVVGLRTIALLINKYNIPTRRLRQVGEWLTEHHETPWASLKFYVGGGKVFFDDPGTGERMAIQQHGQQVFPFEMIEVIREMEKAADHLRQRAPDQIGRIVRDRQILHNAPVLAGTRVPTSAVWNFHEDGYDTDAIIHAYPRLTPDDIQAAVTYEASLRQKRAG